MVRRLLWLAFWAAPPAVAAFGISVCPSALILGTSCPGCGLTRALKLLVAGDVAGSYALHPVGWLVAPALVVMFGIYGLRYLRTGDSSMPCWGRVVLGAIVILLLIVWLARLGGAFGGAVVVS
jgi:hypothetical protein